MIFRYLIFPVFFLFLFSSVICDADVDKLFKSILADDLDTVRSILELNRTLLNATDMDGNNLLGIAAHEGSTSIILYLINELHFDIEEQDSDEFTALDIAVYAGQLESLKLLLELGANTNSTFDNDDTLLHYAVTRGNVDIVEVLLRYFDVDVRKTGGATPAFIAAKEGNLDILRLLLENGADPYARENDGSTLLHVAAKHSNIDIVKELIQYNDLINATNAFGEMSIEYEDFTAAEADMEIVKELVDAGSYIPDKTIWIAFYYGSYDTLKYLVVNSGKVNLVDALNCGETLLMKFLTTNSPSIDMITFMLDQGADVNIKNCNNVTALHRAAYYEDENTQEILKLLLDKGADINAPDNDGSTPLDYAQRRGNKNVGEYLKRFGAKTGINTSTISDYDSLETTESVISS